MIVELIGPAGSGKSTLAAVLDAVMPTFQVEHPPSFRRLWEIPFFINNSLKMISWMSRVCRDSDCQIPMREQLFFLIVLNGWHEILQQKKGNAARVYILDQGPIYMLTILRLYGSSSLGLARMRLWWERTIENWAQVLDVLVWLDAPLPVLIDRVRSREVWHGVKEMDAAAASQYLDNYNVAYAEVVAQLSAQRNSPRIIRLDTNVYSIQDASEFLYKELNTQEAAECAKKFNSPNVNQRKALRE